MSRARELAGRALGTCGGYVDEIGELSAEECAELDSMVFQCDACGWWFEAGDARDTGGGQVCGECVE